MALVSIVMPVKNTSLFLKECLDSIINQSYIDWELLAVDDHSNDNSLEILNEYRILDHRIHVFKNRGTGVIPALQLAFEQSSGNFISRMDSDDIMASNKLQLMVQILQSKGDHHLAVGLVQYFHKEVLGNGYKRYEIWLNKLTATNSNYSEIYKECSIPSPNWMVSRSDFEKCGGFYANMYPEDYDLAFRFRNEKLQIAGINEVLHYWRDYSTRSSRVDSNYADNKFTALKVHHFINQDLNRDKTLVLWGAGRKGKDIAKTLVKNDILFNWYCDSDSKIGKNIYGVNLEDYKLLKYSENSQIIISISAKSAEKSIKEVMDQCDSCDFFRFT